MCPNEFAASPKGPISRRELRPERGLPTARLPECGLRENRVGPPILGGSDLLARGAHDTPCCWPGVMGGETQGPAISVRAAIPG